MIQILNLKYGQCVIAKRPDFKTKIRGKIIESMLLLQNLLSIAVRNSLSDVFVYVRKDDKILNENLNHIRFILCIFYSIFHFISRVSTVSFPNSHST